MDIFLIVVNFLFGILNMYLAFSPSGLVALNVVNFIIGFLNFFVVGWLLATKDKYDY